MTSLSITNKIFTPMIIENLSEGVDFSELFPDELLVSIFKNLPLRDLAVVGLVNRTCQRVSSEDSVWEPQRLFPLLNVSKIDAKIWNECCDTAKFEIYPEEAAPVTNKAICKTVADFCRLKLQEDAGITILCMPRGLSFNKLEQLAAFPKKGKATGFSEVYEGYRKYYGSQVIEFSETIVITNSILFQNPEYHETEWPIGYDRPSVLNIATLAILTYLNSDEARDCLFKGGVVNPTCENEFEELDTPYWQRQPILVMCSDLVPADSKLNFCHKSGFKNINIGEFQASEDGAKDLLVVEYNHQDHFDYDVGVAVMRSLS